MTARWYRLDITDGVLLQRMELLWSTGTVSCGSTSPGAGFACRREAEVQRRLKRKIDVMIEGLIFEPRRRELVPMNADI